MGSTLPNIIFFGNERIATGVTTSAPTLNGLIKASFPVAAVVINENQDTKRGRSQRELEVATVAHAHDIPVLTPRKPTDIIDQLRAYNAPVAVLVAYGRIIPQSIIDIFPHGIINIHPSLLPLHRGPTPLESVILDGSSETGVSIMQLSSGMDSGDVYQQITTPLRGDETKQTLADTLLHLGADAVVSLLPQIVRGEITPQPQDHTLTTYDALITKHDGLIDWQKPAERLEREIRAYALWPKSRTTIGAINVVIKSALVYKKQIENHVSVGTFFQQDRTLLVACGADTYLQIDSLQPDGKKEMTATAFLAGYSHLLS